MSKLSRFRRRTNGFTKGNHFNLGIFDFKGAISDNTRSTSAGLNVFSSIASTIANNGRGMTLSNVMSTFCSSMTLPATQTPATLVNIAEGLPKVSIPGAKIYSPWSVDFFGDEAMLLRSMFVKWHQLVTNDTNHSYGLPSSYKSNLAYACLLSPMDIPVHCYTFKGLWPSEIGAMTVSQSSGEIMTFNVTFSYDYFTLNEVEGFGLAMASEANDAFQQAGGLFGGGLGAGAKTLFDKIVHAPMGVDVKIPF